MTRIEDIDKNFKIETNIEKEGLKFYDSLQKPFEIYGVYMDGGKFRRMPESVAEKVNPGVLRLHADCAGGRIRFCTDSPFVAISAEYENVGDMSHFPLSGSAGFDLYINEGVEERYVKTFVPPRDTVNTKKLEALHEFGDVKMRAVTINMPLHSSIKNLYLRLCEKTQVELPAPYVNDKPIVYYGSSITQGGCASRPGNCYQGHISRRFNCDYINLGFSGNAKSEDAIIDYIKNLDMSIFVYDYDHNAPNPEHLKNTHEKMFKAIREQNPDLPIIIMSSPTWILDETWQERRDIIEQTYKNAISAGDKNVYFLDGKALMALCENNGTVDNCHPTDLGFFSMAKAVGDVIERIWK